MDITDILIKAGFTPYDILMLYFGPILGAVGGFAHAFLVDFDWSKMPKLEYSDTPTKEQKKSKPTWHSTNIRGIWLIGRLLLGYIAGLSIVLFFLGSLSPTMPAVSKIFLLCLIAGFGAPKVLGHIDTQLVKRLEKAIVATSANNNPH